MGICTLVLLSSTAFASGDAKKPVKKEKAKTECKADCKDPKDCKDKATCTKACKPSCGK